MANFTGPIVSGTEMESMKIRIGSFKKEKYILL